jgi:hypothetical protein
MSDAKITQGTREVTFFDVDPASHIGNCLLNVGWYERPNLDFIRSLNVQGNYVDAGSFIGTHALFFALFCPAKRVYAFEPKTVYYQHLLQNIRGNWVKNCLAYNYALVEAPGVQMNPDEGETFLTATLDEFHLQDVRVMKIDVENMELRVLKGARRTLKTVEHLFAEVWTDEVYARRGEPSPMAEICALLELYGLKFQRKLEWEDLCYWTKG